MYKYRIYAVDKY